MSGISDLNGDRETGTHGIPRHVDDLANGCIARGVIVASKGICRLQSPRKENSSHYHNGDGECQQDGFVHFLICCLRHGRVISNMSGISGDPFCRGTRFPLDAFHHVLMKRQTKGSLGLGHFGTSGRLT